MNTAPFKKNILVYGGTLIATAIVLLALYTWGALSWTYSEGERAGFLQKMSRRGWLCKTWEGELSMVAMPGATPEKFLFSVRDEAVAQDVETHMGTRVALVYQQHKGVPSTCFGETEYFVVKVIPQTP